MLNKIKDFLFPKPKTLTFVYEGTITEKFRLKRPPRSYSPYMPQATLDRNYKSNPDRYDGLYLVVGNKDVDVSASIWNEVEVGMNVKITHSYLDSSGSLMSAIKSAGSDSFTLEVKDQ